MIRILVVDDHPVVREGLIAILSTQTDFHVAGQAEDGQQAIELFRETQPDVILLDLEMPGMDGVEVLREIKKFRPEVRAIVFTAFDTDERILTAVRAGAKGYLLKGAPRAELFQAVRIVSDGGSLLQPIIASRLIERISNATPAGVSVEKLTDRELEVLNFLAQGKTNKEIARSLAITERTVKFHVSSILGKLGAGNRTEAVTLAAQRGLVELKRDDVQN